MGPWEGPYEKPANWQQKRWNDLEVYNNPKGWFWFGDHKTHSDYYDVGIARLFAEKAKQHGVDPLLYVALGISESGLGNQAAEDWPRINFDAHRDEMVKLYGDRINNIARGPEEHYERMEDLVDFGARHLARSLKRYPKDLLSGVQAYSGTGRVPYGGDTEEGHRFFGKDIDKIDLWKEKPQGKRILGIYERLKKDKGLQAKLNVAPERHREAIPKDRAVKKVSTILESNADKNFVQRILKPDVSPTLDLGPGEYGTHMMSSAEVDDKNIVFPEIVQMPDGNLKRLSPSEAVGHALRTKEFIEFPSRREAEWFAKNYKRVWGGDFNP